MKLRDLFAGMAQPIRRVGVHVMTRRILHWSYCANCGLVRLKNEASLRALKAPCVWYEEP